MYSGTGEKEAPMAVLLYVAAAVFFGGLVAIVLNGAENNSRPRRGGRGRA